MVLLILLPYFKYGLNLILDYVFIAWSVYFRTLVNQNINMYFKVKFGKRQKKVLR